MRWKQIVNHPLAGLPHHQQLSRVLLNSFPRFQTPENAAEWTAQASVWRERALRQVYLRNVPPSIAYGRPTVVWGDTIETDAPYRIRKLRYEAWPGYWIPALLYEPRQLSGRVPAVLNPNGHHRGGKAAIYKQARCANLARRGMLALNTEFIGQGELEADSDHNLAARLSLAGIPGVALFYLAMKRGLDVLLDHPHADPERTAMTGLSGGGWQTIVLSALDTRIKATIPVAGYTALWARTNCVNDIGDYEQCPPDLATVLDYDALTALLAPRPTLIILNSKDDCCFRTDRTKPVVYDAIKPTFAKLGAEGVFRFYSNVDPGTHNYEADNRRQLYRFLNDIFKLETPLHDLHTPAELYPEGDLNVGLPGNQLTLTDLTRQQARLRLAELTTPTTDGERQRLRQRLRAVLRLPGPYPVQVAAREGDGRIRRLLLKVGPWSLPVAIREAKRATDTAVLLLHDQGMAFYAKQPAEARHQAAVDLSFFGHQTDSFQRNLLLEAAGHRLLGILTAQLIAIIDAVCRDLGVQKVTIKTCGMNVGMIALLSAVFSPERVATLDLTYNLSSLRLLVERHSPYHESPSLFCPDLLRVADIPQLNALIPGIPIHERWRSTMPSH